MKDKDSTVNAYCKKVCSLLSCNPQHKSEFKNQIIHDINTFCAETPQCTWDELIEGLGTPEDYAEACMLGIDEKEIQNERKRVRRIQIMVISSISILLALTLSCTLYLWLRRPAKYITIETVIYAEEPPPPDFFIGPDGTVLEDGEGYEVPPSSEINKTGE